VQRTPLPSTSEERQGAQVNPIRTLGFRDFFFSLIVFGLVSVVQASSATPLEVTLKCLQLPRRSWPLRTATQTKQFP
jgi:hypothetical protein